MAISSVERLSRRLKISSFAASFVILGLFTSISEFSVGINAVIDNDPEIFVGNLIGASIVIFMLLIPILAITGRSIKISREFQGFNLPMSLIVIAAPVIFSIDGTITRTEGLITVLLFGFLVVCVQFKRGLLGCLRDLSPRQSVRVGEELLKIIFGIGVIFIASKFVVEQTLYFSQELHISPFLISLLLIGIGTNIPELALAVRSIFMRSNQVVFGDYVGSASFNSFIFGCLTIAYGSPIILNNNYVISLLFLIGGLLGFYLFARTKNSISRLEGFALLVLYIAFLFIELYVHKIVVPI